EISGVDAIAAVQDVTAGTAAQVVVAAAAGERIVAGAAAQPGLLAEAAVARGDDGVVAVAAIEPVSHAAIAGDLVVAVAADDQLDVAALILPLGAVRGEDAHAPELVQIDGEGGEGGAGEVVLDPHRAVGPVAVVVYSCQQQ